MVDFRINWTLQIGEVRKPRLPGMGKSGYDTGRCGFQPHRILGKNLESNKTCLSLVGTEN